MACDFFAIGNITAITNGTEKAMIKVIFQSMKSIIANAPTIVKMAVTNPGNDRDNKSLI